MSDWKIIQEWAGAKVDGIPGPATARAIIAKAGLATFDRAAFLDRYINLQAAALTRLDRDAAATRLNVTVKHIEMLRTVESNGKSFDNSGRPVILFEPHIFHRRTDGLYSTTHFSYATRGEKPYPKLYDDRWNQLADAAAYDEDAALESASWGLFQVMGFHWESLGYDSVQDFTNRMVIGEVHHLEAMIRYIEINGLANELRACSTDPETCRPFARGYNGKGYESNNYHIKMARAMA